MYNGIMKQNITLKQQKLIALLKQELANKKFSKTFGQLMIEAGYSPNTAEKPSEKALNSPAVQDALKEFVDMLDEKARLAFGMIDKEIIKDSSGRDRAYIGDIMVKNKQLLSGNATERQSINIEISEEVARKNA